MKPQFARCPIVVFTYDYKPNHKFGNWGRDIKFVSLEDYGWSNRETVLSAFVLESYKHVQTPYFVKIDGDTHFKTEQDVFKRKEFKFDIFGHRWGYIKPAHWVKDLDEWATEKGLDGPNEYRDDFDETRKTYNHRRLASFICLHKTEFVKQAASICGDRLPVPSHDTYLWYIANRLPQYNWGCASLKCRGACTLSRWRSLERSINSVYLVSDKFTKHRRQIRLTRKNGYGLKHNLLNKVQLEITTDCRMGCLNCDRSCSQAPSKENMSVSQIEKFVRESIDCNHVWRRIDVIGGEPTLHPYLSDVLSVIHKYKELHPKCKVRLSTHGVGETTINIIESLPSWVCVRNSNKTTSRNMFSAYNKSPYDSGISDPLFCDVPWRCGLGLTRYGYFPCGAGASLARVYGLNIGIKHLKDISYEAISEIIPQLCKHCGHCFSKVREQTKTTIITPSWKEAYSMYATANKNLTLY